jgi:hypothetical protein
MNYILSPEFHRNLWLKFTPFKIWAAPVIVALAVYIQQKLGLDSKNLIFIVTIFIWGNYEAGTALQEEIKAKTWDLQRMSSITPLQLGFGKLFGVTAYTWYFGLLGLLASMFFFKIDSYTVISLIVAGIFGQAVAFLLSLSDVFSSSKMQKSGGIGAVIGGIVISSFTMKTLVPQYGGDFSNQMLLSRTSILWFEKNISADIFVFASIGFFLGWALIGIYRIIRAELMYRTTPAVWAAFGMTTAVYMAGFLPLPTVVSLFLALLLVTYFTMVYEPFDLRKYQRFFLHWRKQDYRRSLENLPRWAATFPIALFFYMMTIGFFTTSQPQHFLQMASFCSALFLFAIRDGIVMHIINLRAKPTQQRFQKLVYFVMVYGLLPVVSFVVAHTDFGSNVDAALSFMQSGRMASNESIIAAIFFPTGFTNVAVCILPVSIQVGIAGWWLKQSYKPSQDA